MGQVHCEIKDGIAVVALQRGKVNALNPGFVKDIRATLATLRDDDSVRAAVLTGHGSFFSFGFDVPELLSYDRADFTAYVQSFTALYAEIFAWPKPLVAALNGHAVAGGCMLALPCDRRIMASGRARIGLNEVTFGAAIFAGITAILRAVVGQRNAELIALHGALYGAEEAVGLGLVDRACAQDEVVAVARHTAAEWAERDPVVFREIKMLARQPLLDGLAEREPASIAAFIDVWYLPTTRAQLEKIVIR